MTATDHGNPGNLAFLGRLQEIIAERQSAAPDSSYTASLFAEGQVRIAQKVGEEGVELALAGVAGERGQVLGEAADLLFHMLVLLRSRDVALSDVIAELEARHRAR
jgi:phosphoribosyl-AMP cyclohydrolase / phosphoribosyl-ATP pyrophosphohydrolase